MCIENGIMMMIHLTVDSSREESNNLLGPPDVAFVVEQE